jgi:hypothetical protein
MFTKEQLTDVIENREVFNRCVNGLAQFKPDGTLWRTARSYKVTDPDDLAEKLRRACIRTDIITGTRAMGMDPKRSAVIVCRMGMDDGYARNVSVLLDHSGKHAIRLIPNVWREFCSNEFYGPAAWRINHCSRLAGEFVADPVPFVRDTFQQLQELHQFMREGAFKVPASPDLWLEIAKHKRLAKQVMRYAERYQEQATYRAHSPECAWVQLQSLTEVKSPTTLRWAHEYLSGKWPVSQ